VKRARKDDDLTWNPFNYPGSFRHRICAMGNQDMTDFAGNDRIANELAILVGDMKAVFSHQRLHFKVKTDIHGIQRVSNLWLTNLVIAFVVEIDLIDGAASSNNQEIFNHV